MKLDPRKPVVVDFRTPSGDVRALLEANLAPVRQLASLSALNIVELPLNSTEGPIRSTSKFDLRILSGEAQDNPEELPNLQKEKERLEKIIASQETQLADPVFRERAPRTIVAKLEATLAERVQELSKVLKRMEQIGTGAGGSTAA
jgi:valyl-tRNA synthetase